tara:strand:+ start:222 stop:875 length:654 start_codon:yes stop_codon:yes gene_type:complete
MPMNKSFNIPMPNKPYVNDFSDNNVHAATYIGPRYLKVQYHNETKYIANIINEGDSMADLEDGPSAVMENHTSTVIDADTDTLVAAYLTNAYETGEVADYSEDLGTTDANGDAETWEYVWNDNGVIHQIYLQGTAKFENNAVVAPEFRAHAITRDSFNETVTNQIDQCTAELARDDTYTDDEKAAITTYKTFLEGISTKYAAVDHWKIPFPQFPDFK